MDKLVRKTFEIAVVRESRALVPVRLRREDVIGHLTEVLRARGIRVVEGFTKDKFSWAQPGVREFSGGVYRCAVYLEKDGELSCGWVDVTGNGDVEIKDGGLMIGPLARFLSMGGYREI